MASGSVFLRRYAETAMAATQTLSMAVEICFGLPERCFGQIAEEIPQT
jgi:hypothetical protein